ncbi:MAG: hypothetical protein H0X13_17985 [Ramlibacter sp.]|nr:hypothetical protein [Ramlibacter sp.]
MDPTVNRVVFGLLVLVASTIATWRDADPPSRMITELVSVVYVPPRTEAMPVAHLAPVAPIEPAAPGPETNAVAAAEPAKPLQVRAPRVAGRTHVPHAKALPNAGRAVTRTARASATAPAAATVMTRTAARHQAGAEPPTPAVFVPIRNLGLYLQARLPASPQEKPVPSKRKQHRS